MSDAILVDVKKDKNEEIAIHLSDDQTIRFKNSENYNRACHEFHQASHSGRFRWQHHQEPIIKLSLEYKGFKHSDDYVDQLRKGNYVQ
jgi:hypothetical protein